MKRESRFIRLLTKAVESLDKARDEYRNILSATYDLQIEHVYFVSRGKQLESIDTLLNILMNELYDKFQEEINSDEHYLDDLEE